MKKEPFHGGICATTPQTGTPGGVTRWWWCYSMTEEVFLLVLCSRNGLVECIEGKHFNFILWGFFLAVGLRIAWKGFMERHNINSQLTDDIFTVEVDFLIITTAFSCASREVLSFQMCVGIQAENQLGWLGRCVYFSLLQSKKPFTTLTMR